MKYIKTIFITILLLTIVSSDVMSQKKRQKKKQQQTREPRQAVDIQQIMFINELDTKSVATYADAFRIFRFQVRIIKGSKSYLLKGYLDEFPLTKGMASLMAARFLQLNNSLMYKIFETERYAYRECVAEKFFSADGSENDIMSGPELIELFTKVGEFKGRK